MYEWQPGRPVHCFSRLRPRSIFRSEFCIRRSRPSAAGGPFRRGTTWSSSAGRRCSRGARASRTSRCRTRSTRPRRTWSGWKKKDFIYDFLHDSFAMLNYVVKLFYITCSPIWLPLFSIFFQCDSLHHRLYPYTVYDAGVWTHYVLVMSYLPYPADYGYSPSTWLVVLKVFLGVIKPT